MTLTDIILTVSLLTNFALLVAWAIARARAQYWALGYKNAMDQYAALRRNSYRRDPRTGRLLPKGK